MLVATKSLPIADELPVKEISTEKHWTENYCYIAYDFKTNVGVYLHIGRWLQDPTIWREMVYVYLPDGTTLNYRSLGSGDCSKGPQGALVRYEFKAPSDWHAKFRGPTNHMTRAQTLAGEAMPERILELMDMDVTFRGAGPILHYEIENNASIGRWHYEQEMLVDATFLFRGQTYEMKGAQGWRDHTRGPRWLADVRGHINMQARLPDGRSVSAFQVWMDDNGREYQLVNEGRMVKGDDFEAIEIVEATRLTSTSQLDDDIKLTLQTSKERIELVGKPLNLMVYSNTATFEILYGFAPKDAPFVCFNQPVQWRYKGEIIGGSCERTLQFGTALKKMS